jgi:hypothetical protein
VLLVRREQLQGKCYELICTGHVTKRKELLTEGTETVLGKCKML